MAGNSAAVEKLDDINVSSIVVRSASWAVKKRPVTVSLWGVGLLVAAFANGFAVNDTQKEAYLMTLQHAEAVDTGEMRRAIAGMKQAEERYRNSQGWFWSCDSMCQRMKDKYEFAQQEAARVQTKRDSIMTEARREVGIWSVFGVKEVRSAFWSAWQSGKEVASRWTMMDAFMMALPGNREESIMSVILKLVVQYAVNLTMGLVFAMMYFFYNVYTLIVSYGEPAMSGMAFFLLVVVSGMATVGTYLIAIYGTIAGGGLFLVKQAAKQAAVEGGRGGQRPRRVTAGYGHYGSGTVGGRSHFD